LPNLAESGKHSYGSIGPDKTPVIALPGEPLANYLSAELFIRPMILKMLGYRSIYRNSKKMKLDFEVVGTEGKANYVRGKVGSEKEITLLSNQSSISTISTTDCLIYLPEKIEKLGKGESAEVIFLQGDLV
jgi:molybdopterin biosynthesis enzyme